MQCLAVGSSGTPGDVSGKFTKDAYEFCVAGVDGASLDGDGVTPLRSALAVPGAETLALNGVTHAPGYPSFVAPELAREFNEGKPWYGSDGIVQRWVPWLKEACDA